MVGDKMNTEERREKILERLQQAEKPLTGTALSKEFAVSRQIIVGDISILRALGTHVYATPRGYIMPAESREKQGVIATLACRHSLSDMLKELCIIVDNGGFVRDVIVEHPLYGEIRADLMLGARHDVEAFGERMAQCQAKPLCMVTDGVHLHTVEAPDEQAMERMRAELRSEGILCESVKGHTEG